jgi:hypothetical protein
MVEKAIKINKNNKKEADDHGVYSMSIIYSLVNEALCNHRGLCYRAFFDSVYTLCGILDDNNSVKFNTIRERLNSITYKGIDINTISGEVVKISSSKILLSSCYSTSTEGRYCELIRDIDGNIVAVWSDDLLVAYDFIGRLIYISLFEILQDKNITLPECLYNIKNIKED